MLCPNTAFRLSTPGTNNTLTVAFNASTTGRWMACTGGWDWGPYSNTFEGTDHSFSKGIWQPVYLLSTPAAAASLTSASSWGGCTSPSRFLSRCVGMGSALRAARCCLGLRGVGRLS